MRRSLQLWRYKRQYSTMKKIALNNGFTIIELLVVIAIIGILASFLMVNYIGVRARARDAQRKSDLRQVQSALELYRSDTGTYPPQGLGNGNFNFPGSCATPTAFKSSDGTVTYMQKIPCDPTNTGNLVYRYKPTIGNFAYTITTCLENVKDNQKDASNNIAAVDGTGTISSCGGGNWSHTLYSP